MTTQLFKWKIYCTTDSQYEYIWQGSAPTSCPVNGGHSVDTNRVSKESEIQAVTIDSTDSPYGLGQRSLLCDTTSGNITVNLPKASRSDNALVLIKKIAAGNTVTINPNGSDQIDSQSNKTLTSNNEIVVLLSDGSDWTSQSQEANVNDLDSVRHLPLTYEKGDIIIDNGLEPIRVPVGTNNYILSADSTTSSGISWSNTMTGIIVNADTNTITNIANDEIKSGAAIDATKIANGTVSNTEFQYLNGVSSAIQTQLNTKITATSSDTLTGKTISAINNTITNIGDAEVKVGANINASKLADGTISNTEYQYLNGVTSNIQTQLNAKLTASSTNTLTNKTINTASNTITVAAADVTSGTFADARISQSSVTQYQGALTITEGQISDLQTYALDSAVVHDTGTETVAGEKTFSNTLKSNVTAGGGENFQFEKSTSSTHWTMNAGNSGFYDNWLLFKNENEGGAYTFAITDSGQFKGKNGSAGAPTYTFDNASNYGMSYDSGGNESLVFSTEGYARLRIEDNGTLSVSGTSNYENLVTADDDIPNKKYVDDELAAVGGSQLALVVARRTTNYDIGTAYADMTFDTTDIETDSSVIEHNNTNTERIDIKADGEYEIHFACQNDPTLGTGSFNNFYGRLYKNGTTLIPGSEIQGANYGTASEIISGISHTVFVSLVNGDYVTVQYMSSITGQDTLYNPTFAIKKLEGSLQGPQGPAGAGSGDVTAAANITANAVVVGDDGVKGVKSANWSISSNGVLDSNFSYAGYILEVHNTKSDGGGNGFRIKAGEQLGDIAFHVADTDDTFQIMEMESDQGYVTMGKTYAQTLTDNGTVYGLDIQHPSGTATDFNTQAGTYRIAGVSVVIPSGGTTGQVLEKVNGTDYNTQWATLTKTIRQGHTWAISGEVKVPSGDTNFLMPFFVSLASGQTAKIVSAKHKINSGTSVTVKVQKDDVDVTGFTGISVTTTATTTNPADVSLADGDKLALVVTAVNGTPKNMSFTLFLEHTV